MAVSHITTSLGLSVRKACPLVDLSRTVYGYKSRLTDDLVLRQRLRELASPLTFGPSDVEGASEMRLDQVQNGEVVLLGNYPCHGIYKHE